MELIIYTIGGETHIWQQVELEESSGNMTETSETKLMTLVIEYT